LADCLTKASVKPDVLIQSVFTGVLPNVDVHPEFRTLIKHKAFLVAWCAQHLDNIPDMREFCEVPCRDLVHSYYCDRHSYASAYLHNRLGFMHTDFPPAMEEDDYHSC